MKNLKKILLFIFFVLIAFCFNATSESYSSPDVMAGQTSDRVESEIYQQHLEFCRGKRIFSGQEQIKKALDLLSSIDFVSSNESYVISFEKNYDDNFDEIFLNTKYTLLFTNNPRAS